MGSTLLQRPGKVCELAGALARNLEDRSVTVKMRTGWGDKDPVAHKLVPMLQRLAVKHENIAAVMVHGRSVRQLS